MPRDAQDVIEDDPRHHTCTNCGKHPASTRWVGEGSTLDYLHGSYSWWCSCCAVGAQLAFARKLARRIPRLEREMKIETRRCGRTKEIQPPAAGAAAARHPQSAAPTGSRHPKGAGQPP
jgi:hypothetical protein